MCVWFVGNGNGNGKDIHEAGLEFHGDQFDFRRESFF